MLRHLMTYLINDLPEKLVSNLNLFADNASLLYVVKDCNLSAINRNNDLEKKSN